MVELKRGFSTLEILIALAIMTTTLSAVILVCFGNEGLLQSAGMDAVALQDAQKLLESEQAQGRQDFRLVQSTSSDDGMYHQALIVEDLANDPYTTKRVTATVSWYASSLLRSVSLTELLTDFDDSATLDTCDSALAGDWTVPSLKNYLLAAGDLLPASAPSGHTFSATNPISNIDAYHGRLYIGISKKAATTNDSIFIFDSSNPTARPAFLGSIDNNSSVTEGVNAVIVAGSYLYAANSHVSNFKTCKPSANCSQLQIFNISNPAAIPAPISMLLPTSSAPFITGTSTSQAVGNSLFYKDGYAYLGLTKTATGPEFNIIDVHDPNNPKWVSGYMIGATINEIYVRNGYAYIATDNQSQKLVILDVHDPQNPSLVASLDPKGTTNQAYGYSFYTQGEELYFGMSSTSVAGSPELYSYAINSLAVPKVTATQEVGASVMDVFARDSKLFLLTSVVGAKAGFVELDKNNLAATGTSTTLPGSGIALDCEGNYFYAASNNGSQGYLSIIGPQL